MKNNLVCLIHNSTRQTFVCSSMQDIEGDDPFGVLSRFVVSILYNGTRIQYNFSGMYTWLEKLPSD